MFASLFIVEYLYYFQWKMEIYKIINGKEYFNTNIHQVNNLMCAKTINYQRYGMVRVL
jgi:hypothetical protein